jgi:hypothetical protein
VDWKSGIKTRSWLSTFRLAARLDESDIEGLIEALTAQIRGKVYASRMKNGKSFPQPVSQGIALAPTSPVGARRTKE